MGVPEHGDERALCNPGAVPGHHAHQDNDGPQIDRSEYGESQLDGAGNFLRRTRLARGYGHKFNSAKGVKREAHGQQRGERAFGKKAAMRGVLRRHPAAQQQPRSQQDKSRDGGDFDHRKPVFETGVVAHTPKIDQQQESGKDQHPEQGRDGRKPECKIGGGSHQLRADRNRDGRPIAGAGYEPRPRVQVKIGIDPERPGSRMHAGEFARVPGSRSDR